MLLDHDPARCFVPYPAAQVPHAPQGPLAGLDFGVKDLFDVAGYPTGGGNPHVLARSGIKAVNAAAVQLALDAGARCVGKTHTDELAFSINGRNAHFGTPRNGAAPDRIPGGSSSGSASAVSNGLCDFALGTDTGGSVRVPANHCGLYGIRPTHDRIPLTGSLDLAPSLDTCGVLARDADVFARASAALLGEDAQRRGQPRLILAEDVYALLEPEVRAVHEPLLEALAARPQGLARATVAQPSFDALFTAFRHVQGREAWQVDGALIDGDGLQLGPGVKERFAFSREVTDAQYTQHSAVRARFRDTLAALLGEDGVLVLPTMPDVAPRLDEAEETLDAYRNRALRMLCLAGLSGFPQVSVPALRRLDAPLGVSLLGPAGSDRWLIAQALALLPAA